MENVLDKLHEDHKNFSRLLAYLSENLKLLEGYEDCDLEDISDAIKYMKQYPDCVHHPLEDVVFKYYKQHDDAMKEQIEGLLREHGELPALTEKLSEMIDSARAGIPQSREELCNYLRDYLSVQIEHMNLEEATVYPEIRKNLTAKDWDSIDSNLADKNDPMFGEQVEQSYAGLLERIMKSDLALQQ